MSQLCSKLALGIHSVDRNESEHVPSGPSKRCRASKTWSMLQRQLRTRSPLWHVRLRGRVHVNAALAATHAQRARPLKPRDSGRAPQRTARRCLQRQRHTQAWVIVRGLRTSVTLHVRPVSKGFRCSGARRTSKLCYIAARSTARCV